MHTRAEPPANERRYTDPILLRNGVEVACQGYCTDVFFRHALGWIKQRKDRQAPFFAYMAHYAVHAPFETDARFAANYPGLKGRELAFATLVEGMDQSLGDLMDHIEAKGIAENTLIFFLGDNGGDAPLAGTDDISSSAPLRGRKGSKWEGGVRVPGLLVWPEKIAEANSRKT